MRAIIDADRLPTAVRYYTRIKNEPAQQAMNDIFIDNIDAEKNLTLESLLKKLEAYGSGGEKEFLVVLHSTPNGLILPVGGGVPLTINADKSVLQILMLASEVFGDLEDSRNPDIAVNDAFLSAWMDFFSRTKDKKGNPFNTSSISQASGVAAKCAAAAKVGQAWVDSACRALHIKEAQLSRLAELANRVRQLGITRLEFRSCRLGGGEGLKEVASFFGAMSFAPNVRTFYVHQPVQIVTNQARLNTVARALGPNSRRFTAALKIAGPTDDVAFAIRVTPLSDAQYSSNMYAINEMAAWNWIASYIWSSMPFFIPTTGPKTKAGFPVDIVVSGFRTTIAQKPFIFPREPEYRGFIEGEF